MAWSRFDDRYDDNRKIKRAWRRHPRAVGLHVMAITYSSRHGTDGAIDLEWLEDTIPSAREREACIKVLVETGLLEPVDGETFQIHDFLEFNPSSAQVEKEREWDRRRKELHRDPELVEAIRKRDKDRCRYCGTLVNWKDRRGRQGATYDHVVPRGPNSLENVVVACRYCNTAKNGRTPQEARMPLLDPGRMGSRSGLAPSQNGSLAPLSDGLTTRPVPTRPGPGSTEL